jgi:hypothetical protein
MTLLKSLVALALIGLTSCSSDQSKDFSLSVEHYGGGAGITITYLIDKNGLQVNTNCDLASCKETTVYKRTFTKAERDSILINLNAFQLDTLKRKYQPEGIVFDGLHSEITFKKGLFSTHRSSFDNVSTPTTEKLFAYIDKLIPEKKYRFATWEQSE